MIGQMLLVVLMIFDMPRSEVVDVSLGLPQPVPSTQCSSALWFEAAQTGYKVREEEEGTRNPPMFTDNYTVSPRLYFAVLLVPGFHDDAWRVLCHPDLECVV